MTIYNDTSSNTALVAIDIAKAKNDIVIERPGSKRRQRLRICNTDADHQRLIAQLGGLGCPVRIGFEATGNYHRPLAWRLLDAGFDLRLISSVALARTRVAPLPTVKRLLGDAQLADDVRRRRAQFVLLDGGHCKVWKTPP